MVHPVRVNLPTVRITLMGLKSDARALLHHFIGEINTAPGLSQANMDKLVGINAPAIRFNNTQSCFRKGKSQDRDRKRARDTMNNTNDRNADEQALHDLFQVSKDGWNLGDGYAYAASFTEDADYILWNGTHLKGRQAIAAAHQQLFETRFGGSRLEGEIQHIRFLSDDIALVHLTDKRPAGSCARTVCHPDPGCYQASPWVALHRFPEYLDSKSVRSADNRKTSPIN